MISWNHPVNFSNTRNVITEFLFSHGTNPETYCLHKVTEHLVIRLRILKAPGELHHVENKHQKHSLELLINRFYRPQGAHLGFPTGMPVLGFAFNTAEKVGFQLNCCCKMLK